MRTIDAYRIVASMSDFHSSRHPEFREHKLLFRNGCIEERLWDTFPTKEAAQKALTSYAAEDGVDLPEGSDSYSRDIWTWSIEDNDIPQSWSDRFDKAENLEDVAKLFNEAEDYTNFDCCAELKLWCSVNEAVQVYDENRKDVFAETDTEELRYSEAANNWYVEEKDHE